MQLPITHPAHLVVVDMVANGASGGLMLRGDLLAYSLVAISTPSGLILVAIHTTGTPTALRGLRRGLPLPDRPGDT